MLIYLYGPDSYRRLQKQKEIVAEYQKKHSGLTAARFYLDEPEELERFKNFALNQSLFGGCRLAVVSNLTADKSRAVSSDKEAAPDKELVRILKNNTETKNLILLISAADRPTRELDFLLKKPAISQSLDRLTPQELRNFIFREAEKRRLSINQSVIGRLIDVYENDGWGLATEIDKLASGGRPPVNFPKVNLWQALQKLSLPLMERLLAEESPAKIFNLLAYQARPSDKVRLADYDFLIKSGKLDYEEALTDFVIS